MTPARILHRIAGSPAVDGCEDHFEERCYMCARPSTRGAPVRRWMGSTFTDQPRCAAPSSSTICEACVWACSWVQPPGHPAPPAGKKGVNLRLFSHLYSGGEYTYANKANKPLIRDFLRSPKKAPWFAAIADGGQKHVLPFTPINLSGGYGGRVLFEEATVNLPRSEDGWSILDDTIDLLTAGATKDEIERGEYRPETWLRCRTLIERFEAQHNPERGGDFFSLIIWLAQRDEEAVAARIAKEKAAKVAKKERGKRGKTKANRRAKGKAESANSRSDLSNPSSLPERGGQSADPLDSVGVSDAGCDADERDSRGVGEQIQEGDAHRDYEQISLFGDHDAR